MRSRRLFVDGTRGVGEFYIDRQCDCRRLHEMRFRLLRVHVEARIARWRQIGFILRAAIFNMQCASQAFSVAKRHYDLGDDLFEGMLDARMIHTCEYWRRVSSLELELVCRKLGLAPGMRVLDID